MRSAKPQFNPRLPKGWVYKMHTIVTLQSGWVIVYEVVSDGGYVEQRTAYVEALTHHVKWDMINHGSHVPIERVRLLTTKHRQAARKRRR